MSNLGSFSDFGIDEALLRRVLARALARGGDAADLFFQRHSASRFGLEDGDINRAFATVELGVGVRVVIGDQVGYAYTEELSEEAIGRAADTASMVARGAKPLSVGAFHVPARAQYYPLGRIDVTTQEKLPLLARLNSQAFERDPRIKKVNVSYGDSQDEILIACSDGRLVHDVQPMTTLGLSIVAEQGTQRETNGYNVAARDDIGFYDEARLERLVKEAVERTTILFEAGQPPAGEMPVVLGAGSSGILLHEAIGHGMEADFNRKNTSIYADKIGKAIAKSFVNVVDDGTIEKARGAVNVDDEGNPTEKTMLVEGGVLRTYIHDEISAKHYKVKPTGNGRRESYRSAPLPRMRSTYMLPGPHDPEEIIKSVKHGIYCNNFSNGQVQIGAGDFTFYVKNGYMIEDGKLTRPIKDVNIIGNGPKVLEQIDMVGTDLKIDEGGWTCGKDGQSVPVSQGMPTVRVSALTVGGRS